MAVFALTGTECLRDQGIETEEQAESEDGDDGENVGAESDSADSHGAVREMADHHGVHDGHEHPAELGENERDGEVDGWAKLFAEMGEKGHGRDRVY